MGRQHGIAIGMIFISFALAGGSRAQKIVPPPPAELEQIYKWVWFAPNGTGYVASQYALVRTRDHGTTWNPVRETLREPIPGIRDILFVNESTFFVDGWRGIWRTTDGGNSFEEVPQRVTSIDDSTRTEEVGEGFFFLDADRGWALGNGQLLITKDAGQKWLQRRLRKRDFGSYEPESLWLFDAQHAIAVGADHVFRTDDEGLHWAAVPNSPRLDEVQCIPGGFCAGRTLRGVGVLHISSDAGKTWQAAPTGLDPDRDEVFAFQVIETESAVLVGLHNDQGRSERAVHSRTPVPTSPPDRGLLVRWNGTTWERHEYAEITRLRAIHFVSATEAWASADFNGIIHSTDGGQSWTFVPDYYRQAAARTPAPTPLYIMATPPPTP